MSFCLRLVNSPFCSFKQCSVLSIVLLVLVLSACAPSTSSPSSNTSTEGIQTEAVKAPQIETVAPIPTAMETFRQLAPAQGLKITPLFTGSTANDEARFHRLEDAVQSLRNDLDTVMPSMVRMVNMEGDLRELIVQLRAINGADANADGADNPSNADTIPSEDLVQTPVTDSFFPDDEIDAVAGEHRAAEVDINAMPVADMSAELPSVSKKPAAKVQTQLLAAHDGDGFLPGSDDESRAQSASIKSVRLGDHGAITRIVLDATEKPGYSAHLENEGRQLVIQLSETGWGAEQTAKLRNKKVINYKFENNRAVFNLVAPMEIKSQQLLSPEAGAGYRIMINLVDAAGVAESPPEDNFLP